MEIKILQVFYGKDGLPYKDKDRQVHFPIAGTGFIGASNTTQIKFYYKELDNLDETTWVAVSKLPNGKVGSRVLESYTDSELNEHYALLELDSYYTQYKGDVFISLQGYQGGVNVDYDEENSQYEIHGTPTIAATGSIKFTINYANQFIGSGETDNVNFQRILAELGTKLGIRARSEHVDELPTVGESDVFYVINNDLSDPNKQNIYIWNAISEHYVWVGDNTLDLSNYYTKTEGEDFEQEINNRVTSVENELESVAQGSPKGVYETLSDLQTAYPDGDTGVFVIKDDGHWYYWNGSAWTDGGVYLASDTQPLVERTLDCIKMMASIASSTFITYSDFANGTLGGVTPNTHDVWRIYSIDDIVADRDLVVSVSSGFRADFRFYTNNVYDNTKDLNVTSSNSPQTIQQGSKFKMLIRRVVEDDTETADITYFLNQVQIKTKLKEDVEEISAKTDGVDRNRDCVSLIANELLATFWIYSDFANGSLAGATPYLPDVWRIYSTSDIVADRDIKVQVNSGFRCDLRFYTDDVYDSTKDVNVTYGNPYTIASGSKFRLLIRRVTENPSEIADVTYFLKQVQINIVSISPEEIDGLKNDSLLIKYQLEWEKGTITDSGTKYTNNKRIRMANIVKLDKDVYIVPVVSKLPANKTIEFKLVYYNSAAWGDLDELIGYQDLVQDTKYKIPKGTYFAITFNYRSDSSMPDVDDIYSSELFKSFYFVDEEYFEITNNAHITDIVALNRSVEDFVIQMNTTIPEAAENLYGTDYDPLSFIHLSDIHNQPKLWDRCVQYANEYKDYFSFAIHTGDYVGGDQTSYTDLYNTAENEIPFLNVVGNHDTYADAQHTLATKQSVYEKLFNHTTGWGVTFDSGVSYAMNYYKDFPDSNIRLIVLDMYYDVNHQKTWLANLLTEAKTLGYHVITAAHQVSGAPQTKIDVTFQTLIPWEENGESVVATDFDEIIGNFISAGGVHIVHLCGHEHQDWFYLSTHGVLNCAVECATTYPGWIEGRRKNGTKGYDCFNAVGIDANLGIIKIARIGHDADAFNRKKELLVYDYINKRIIFNN